MAVQLVYTKEGSTSTRHVEYILSTQVIELT